MYYSFSNGKSSRLSSYPYGFAKLKYDSVVDRSKFRPDSQQVREFQLTGSGSNMDNLQYDNPNRTPSDEEVKIRQGQYDKAEISQMQLKKAKDVEQSLTEAQEAKAKEKKKKLDEARQEYLDKATGFKGSDQTETVR